MNTEKLDQLIREAANLRKAAAALEEAIRELKAESLALKED